MRLLTKSRYKLGLECPNKLFFTKKKNYSNLKNQDPFLEALASGGFQVEELARMHYPSGVLLEDIPGEKYNYAEKVKQTSILMEQENVTVFEAAFQYENLFIRVDILNKRGDQIELIEVKAKSFHPHDTNTFWTKSDKIAANWKFYLFDVAFQKYVIQNAYPQFNIRPLLMLADKLKTTTIEGLNQKFRITKNADNRTGIIKKIDRLINIDEESVMSKVDVSDLVQHIEEGETRILEEFEFEEGIKYLSKQYGKDDYSSWPLSFPKCKGCEFKNNHDTASKGLQSGFEYCFQKQLNWSDMQFSKPNAFEIWDFRKWPLLEDRQTLLLEEMNEDDFGEIKLKPGVISRVERQLIQMEKSINKDHSVFLLQEELKDEIDSWEYPLNFIDFETSAAPLPYHVRQKPYEQTIFQYSHHILYKDGRVEHANEYVNVKAGEFPNFLFLRSLKKALEQNQGTIFMYSSYENTMLNTVMNQLQQSNETDKEDLISFVKSIAKPTGSNPTNWEPIRAMVDLRKVIVDYYYNPYTHGSNSIKYVLPAIFETSKFIRKKYTKPIKEIQVSSKNFEDDMIWLSEIDGKITDPYSRLGKVFPEWIDNFEYISEMEELNNGGAALMAYGKTQYADMTGEEREYIRKALLKYCELDTLAMVMVCEHLMELVKDF